VTPALTIPVVVRRVRPVTPLIRQFTLAREDGAPLPAFSAGAHVVVVMPGETRTLRNPYSLMGSSADLSTYDIAVRLSETSRGGSRFMHEAVGPGSRLAITPPVNLFPLDRVARRHLLLAGGVGITPVAAHVRELMHGAVPFEVHCGARSIEHATLALELQALAPAAVTLHLDTPGPAMDVDAILAGQPLGTHVYVCGPGGMIEGVIAAARAAGWPDSHIHWERFTAPPAGKPFEVTLSRSGKRVSVPPEMSLLEAIEAAGVDAPFLCRGGACGQCETTVLALDGTLLHHDVYLSDAQKAAGDRIMPCVSRADCRTLVLDR
jgi:dimethylamine monooxygenase subunit B